MLTGSSLFSQVFDMMIFPEAHDGYIGSNISFSDGIDPNEDFFVALSNKQEIINST